MMEYRTLKYFLTVAHEGNITRASEILHLSQPALSRALIQLEDELGTTLFVRGRRHVTLTDAGLLFHRRAQEILDLTEKTENEFKHNPLAVSGVISIGSGEAETMRRLAGAMRVFSERYPDVKFNLYSNNADFIRERLDKGLLDIGILIEPSDLSKYEFIRLKDKERYGAIVPCSSPLAEKEYLTAQDLIGYKIFTSARDSVLGVSAWFGDVYDKLDIYVTFNLIYNAAMLVDCGLGAALTIEGAVSLYKNPNIVFKPFYPEFTASSVLVWKKHQPASAAVMKFWDFIKGSLSDAETCGSK